VNAQQLDFSLSKFKKGYAMPSMAKIAGLIAVFVTLMGCQSPANDLILGAGDEAYPASLVRDKWPFAGINFDHHLQPSKAVSVWFKGYSELTSAYNSDVYIDGKFQGKGREGFLRVIEKMEAAPDNSIFVMLWDAPLRGPSSPSMTPVWNSLPGRIEMFNSFDRLFIVVSNHS
jgi:hypothetical protein